MKEKFFITTAITYTSKLPHIGNIYEIILTDSIARYKKKRGYDVFFLTGTDEHGQKIQAEAEARGVSPQEYVDEIAGGIRKLWDLYECEYDRFIRTTDERHMETVKKIYTRLYEQGDIYKGSYEGMYCAPCESFWTESQLKDGRCPDCGAEVKKASEEAYYLKLSNYTDRLVKYYEEHPDFIMPVSRKNEMINNFIKPGLQDLCVSRSSFTWGIPLDFDKKHVSYVWIDALSNYITAIGYDPDKPTEEFKKLWPADLHVIGKDIVRFHTIYWPIILMALGLPLPKKILGHPWLLFGESKMSKSKGNVLYGDRLAEQFGVDAVRYYLLSEMGFLNDGSITYESLISRINSDLANVLGNLVSRTAAMIKQYFGGRIPEFSGNTSPEDTTLRIAVSEAKRTMFAKMDEYCVADAVAAVMNALKACNKYIDETAPWLLAKDPEKRVRLADVMATLTESIRICASLMFPFIPSTSRRIAEIFGCGEEALDYDIPDYSFPVSGKTVAQESVKLFERIDEKKFMADIAREKEIVSAAEKKPSAEKKNGQAETISIDDFAKVNLTVGKVIACEKVAKSDKLLKLTVDIGEIRTVASGIARFYSPEELIGRKVILVSNLRPANIRGIESNGMILASGEDDVKVVFVDDSVPVGTKVR